MSDFLKAVQERVVIYDGAMGTNIQSRNPSVDDYWGKEGCNELLVLSRPDLIKDIHAAFYQRGLRCRRDRYFRRHTRRAGGVRPAGQSSRD